MAKKTTPKPTKDEVMDARLDSLYGQAEAVSGFNSDVLRAMALLAHDHRADAGAMKLLSFVWGRNARYLARAVGRWPNWFMGVDGVPVVASEPDQLLALFSIAQLPPSDDEHLYETFRRYSLRAWQVRERVELWKEVHSAKNSHTRLRVKSARLTVTSDAHRTRITAEWSGEPLIDPRAWDKHDGEAVFVIPGKESDDGE